MDDPTTHELRGRCRAVGVASAYFTEEQRARWGLDDESRMLIVQVDDGDPVNIPVGLVWADRVLMTIREDPD